VSGAGAAALACLDLLVDLGFPIANIYVTDLAGVVYQGRQELMDPDKARFAQDTALRTLAEVIPDADIFLGLSAGGVLKPEMVAKMAPNPLILALANPTPEILPEEAKAVRPDAVICTGRSDYPNQVNNVLCFPYIFRGALDCGATTITREMEIAVVHAIADLAHAEQSDIVASTYNIKNLSFGPEYLIPLPFDPRLLTQIAPRVAKAAEQSGVATRPIADLDAYADHLQQFVYHSGTFMKPLFSVAKAAPMEAKRIVYAEGEDERVLRAVQVVVDERLARPILVGRPAVLERRIERFGLRLKMGEHFDVINPDYEERYRDYWQSYYEMTNRKGVSQDYAKLEMRRRHTLIGAMMIHKGHADGMICGTYGTVDLHLKYIDQVLGKREGAHVYAAMNFLILPERQLAVVDTHVNQNPSAEQLAEITVLAAEEMQRFGISPRVALLSHSNFGSSNAESACKMRDVLGMVQQRMPGLEIDGEMHGDTALNSKLRMQLMPQSTLKGDANLLVMPNLDAANIAYNLVKTAAGNGIAIGPVLLGCARPVHVLTPSATVRRIVNMTALCVVDAVSER
ncbi:MAG TPA: phosphate acyltransferase, partial [Ramlibacter sp.]|nr:phosphate acyltransferase [Ramlibacter sp.]